MKAHPAAEMFPLMTGDDLRDLADDIKANGLLEKIVTLDGMILDGRNRYAACNLAGIPPRLIAWDGVGGSPTLYVVAKNLHRRHLTIAQRAAIGVEMKSMLREEAKERQATAAPGVRGGRSLPVDLPEGIKGEARDIAAKAVQVGSSTIGHAQVVKDKDPKAFERLKRGESTVDAEYHKLHTAKPRAYESVATDKWTKQKEAAQKHHMEHGFGLLEGACTGLRRLSIEHLRAACSEEEVKTWATAARSLASELRDFARELEEKSNGS